MVGYLHWLEFEIRIVVRENRFWMTWNLILAALPAALAAVLFRPGRRHGVGWWAGVVAFALLLPNAPYVVSDLKYLHPAVRDAASRGVVVTGVLPLFAVYVGFGLLFYWSAVGAVLAEVARWRPNVRSWWVVAGLHGFCTVGVLVGRVARVNSWNALTAPLDTARRSEAALTATRAPAELATALVAITAGYALMSVLMCGAEILLAAVRTRGRQLGHRLATG